LEIIKSRAISVGFIISKTLDVVAPFRDVTILEIQTSGTILNPANYMILILMGIAAVIAAGSFSIIARYLFDRGLADRNAQVPDILVFYKTYMAHTKKQTGRIGTAFWVHCVSAGVFITTGVFYTIGRFIVPRFL